MLGKTIFSQILFFKSYAFYSCSNKVKIFFHSKVFGVCCIFVVGHISLNHNLLFPLICSNVLIDSRESKINNAHTHSFKEYLVSIISFVYMRGESINFVTPVALSLYLRGI